jgi:geranylgeranyl diphosphate synthase type I
MQSFAPHHETKLDYSHEQQNTPLEELRHRIDRRLPQILTELSYPHPDSVTSAPLMKSVVAQAITSDQGGKRLRALALIAASHLQLPGQTLLPADCVQDLACSIEIFQTGALVHDDIMDNSPVRRGRSAAHVALSDAYQSFALHNEGEQAEQTNSSPAHIAAHQGGQGLAIMLGDLLATVSLMCAHNACHDIPSSLCSHIMTVLLQMQREVEIGQVLDEANSVTPLQNADELIRNCKTIYARKTASYTCVAPLMIGFLCAGMDPSTAQHYASSIGIPLGIAFQLCDDLSDLLPSQPPTGKPLGGDIRDGKRTILLADALSSLPDSQRSELITLYEQPERNPQQVQQARSLLLGSGAVQHSFSRIHDLTERVQQEVSRMVSECTPARESMSFFTTVLDLFSDVSKFAIDV